MNFFSNWGKIKISSVNKSADNLIFDGNLMNDDITQKSLASGSRPFHKIKNRRKNFLFTRSLWYDTERDKEEPVTKLKKAQSFDNLDRSFQEELSSLNIIDKTSNDSASKQNKQEATSLNTLKKSFSLENLSWKGSNKGKSKGVVTKDMISNPTDVRKITDGSHFPSFEPFDKIIEEHETNCESGKIIVLQSKSIDIELEIEQNQSFISVQHSAVKLRKSCSMESLPIKQTISVRKSSCPNSWLEIKVDDDSLHLLETNEICNTASTSEEDGHNNVMVSSCEMDSPCNNINNLEKGADDSGNIFEMDKYSSKSSGKSVEVFSSDYVDGGTLRKPAKQNATEIVLKNRKERFHIVKDEQIFEENFVSTLQIFRYILFKC